MLNKMKLKIEPCGTTEMIFFHELNLNQLLFFGRDLINSLQNALKTMNQFRRYVVYLSINRDRGNQKRLINPSLVHQMLCFLSTASFQDSSMITKMK